MSTFNPTRQWRGLPALWQGAPPRRACSGEPGLEEGGHRRVQHGRKGSGSGRLSPSRFPFETQHRVPLLRAAIRQEKPGHKGGLPSPQRPGSLNPAVSPGVGGPWGSPGGASGKESARAGPQRDVGSVPGSGRSPGGGHVPGESPWTEEPGGPQSLGAQRVRLSN